MKILVISSGTSQKQDCKAPAAQMYTGLQLRYLMEGLEKVRKAHGKRVIDVGIISEKYGLLSEWDVIAPYEDTFNTLTPEEIVERSNLLQLHDQTKALIMHYDLVFFLLGKEYVQALQLPFEDTDAITQFYLLGPTHKYLIPDLPNLYFIPAGKELARKLGVTTNTLKGDVFKRLCCAACREGLGVFQTARRIRDRVLEFAHDGTDCSYGMPHDK